MKDEGHGRTVERCLEMVLSGTDRQAHAERMAICAFIQFSAVADRAATVLPNVGGVTAQGFLKSMPLGYLFCFSVLYPVSPQMTSKVVSLPLLSQVEDPASTLLLPNNLLSPPPFPPGVLGLPVGPASNEILDRSGAPASNDGLLLRGAIFALAVAVAFALAVGGRGKWKMSFSGTVGGFPFGVVM